MSFCVKFLAGNSEAAEPWVPNEGDRSDLLELASLYGGQPRQRNVMTLGRIDENGGQVERLLQSLLKARGLVRETASPQVRFESALSVAS